MQQTTASLLLVRGDARPPQRLLIALRGYGSDRAALRQTRPLLTQRQAAVTVLPLANGQAWQPDRLLAAKSPARLHLLACLRDLGGLPITVRLRPGDPTDQLITELSAADYDLLVIAAEAWGDFVRHALAHIQAAGVLPDQPVLIVRPPIVAGPHPSAPDGAPLEGQ
jgi:nucleotide-binding universal stress UspA family protein